MKKNILSIALGLLVSIGAFAQTAYEVSFKYDRTTYKGLLLMNADFLSGVMRVKYREPSCNCERVVQQNIYTELTDNGLVRLAGYNPTNARTGETRSETYKADNFYFVKSGYAIKMYNIDDAGNTSEASIKEAITETDIKKLLAQFEWE